MYLRTHKLQDRSMMKELAIACRGIGRMFQRGPGGGGSYAWNAIDHTHFRFTGGTISAMVRERVCVGGGCAPPTRSAEALGVSCNIIPQACYIVHAQSAQTAPLQN